MSGRLSLRANFVWTFCGNVTYNASLWLLVVVLAQFGDTATVGRFSLGMAIASPVAYFCNVQLRAVLVTDREQPRPFGTYLALRLLTGGLVFVIVTAVALVSGLAREVAGAVIAIGAARAIETVSDIYYGLEQHHERMNRIAISVGTRGIGGAAVVTAVWLATDRLDVALWGMAGVWLAVLLFYDRRHAHALLREHGEPTAPRWERPELIGLFWTGLPLGIAGGLMLLSSNTPRYIISGTLGVEQLGIFAALIHLMMTGNLVVNALGHAAIPRLSSLFHEGRRERFLALWAKLGGLGLVLGAGAVAGAIWIGKPLLRLVYGAEYAAHSDLFVWLMVNFGVASIASFSSFALTSLRKFRVQPFVFALKLVVASAGTWLLLPSHGLIGAAWSLIAANLVQLTLVAAVVLRGVGGTGRLDREGGGDVAASV